MARRECCREIEMAIFATRTNLPVSDFQTWQVWCPLWKGIHHATGIHHVDSCLNIVKREYNHKLYYFNILLF